jgi:hypothetical protein
VPVCAATHVPFASRAVPPTAKNVWPKRRRENRSGPACPVLLVAIV